MCKGPRMSRISLVRDDGTAVGGEGCNCAGCDFVGCGMTRLGILPEIDAGPFAAKATPPVMRKTSAIRAIPLVI